jgi:hypothetical protein
VSKQKVKIESRKCSLSEIKEIFPNPQTVARASKLLRENIAHFNFEPVNHGFKLVERQMMFALFNSEQGHRCEARHLAEFGIRQFPSEAFFCALLVRQCWQSAVHQAGWSI